MFWNLLRKEILQSLITFRFLVGTVLCVMTVCAIMPVLLVNHNRRMAEYHDNVTANEAELRNVRVYMNATPTVYRRPSARSIFCAGVATSLPNYQSVSHRQAEDNTFTDESQNGNYMMASFPAPDITMVLEILIGLLALLLAYDAVTGEKENGTLKLVLSEGVGRFKLLLSKYAAGLVILWVPISIAFLSMFAILMMSKSIALDVSDWTHVGVMYGLTLLYGMTMFTLGLFISCVCSTSAVSLIAGLFAWICVTLVIPCSVSDIVGRMRKTATTGWLMNQIDHLNAERDRRIKEATQEIRAGGWYSERVGAFGHSYYLLCSERFLKTFSKDYAIAEPIRIAYRRKKNECQRKVYRDLVETSRWIQILSSVSPSVTYKLAMSQLAGTDVDSFLEFTRKVKEYEDIVADYLRQKTDGFSDISYFTTCQLGDWEKSRRQESSADSANRLSQSEVKEPPPLDLGDLPRFERGETSLAANLQSVSIHVSMLLALGVLSLVLSLAAIERYDVR